MARAGQTWIAGRLAAALAAAALVVQILVPAGVMVSRVGGAPALVICTGHGVWRGFPDSRGHSQKAPKDGGGVCAFAAHGASAPVPALATLSEAGIERAAPVQPSAAADLLPGRGLAAPPPPSQGPPDLSI